MARSLITRLRQQLTTHPPTADDFRRLLGTIDAAYWLHTLDDCRGFSLGLHTYGFFEAEGGKRVLLVSSGMAAGSHGLQQALVEALLCLYGKERVPDLDLGSAEYRAAIAEKVAGNEEIRGLLSRGDLVREFNAKGGRLDRNGALDHLALLEGREVKPRRNGRKK